MPVPECFRCAEAGETDPERAARDRRRRLYVVRVVRDADATTLGSTLLCATCIGDLDALDPDPLTVSEGA